MNNLPHQTASILVQLILGVIMLAVAFEVTVTDLKQLPKQWKKILLGYVMQISFLPAYILGLLMIIDPDVNLILAFLLLAACPGGNLSQFFVMRCQGNIGLSMGLTFISTLLSPITVPGIFYLATHMRPDWATAYKQLSLPWGDIFVTLCFSLFLPLMVGMWLAGKTDPRIVRIRTVIQKCVPWLLLILMSGAAWNFRSSIPRIDFTMVMMVLGISLSCLFTTYFLSRAIGQDYFTGITYAWEVSIQNSGLGMVLGIVYFANVPEVSLVCALWGVWQMVMGVVVSGFIRKIITKDGELCQSTNVG